MPARALLVPPCSAVSRRPPPLHHCLAQSLAANVVEAYYRLEPFLRAAVASFVRQHLDTFAENEDGSDKQFWLSCYGLPHTDRLRALRSAKIGKLSQFVGTVTRTTDVRPELFSGTFRCMECMTGKPHSRQAAARLRSQWLRIPRPLSTMSDLHQYGGPSLRLGLQRRRCCRFSLCCRLPVARSGARCGAAVQVHPARHLSQRHLRQHVSPRRALMLHAGGQALRTIASAGGAPTACPRPAPPSLLCSTAWSLVMEQSTFVDWQKAKVQENPDEVRGGRQAQQAGHAALEQAVARATLAARGGAVACASHPSVAALIQRAAPIAAASRRRCPRAPCPAPWRWCCATTRWRACGRETRPSSPACWWSCRMWRPSREERRAAGRQLAVGRRAAERSTRGRRGVRGCPQATAGMGGTALITRCPTRLLLPAFHTTAPHAARPARGCRRGCRRTRGGSARA